MTDVNGLLAAATSTGKEKITDAFVNAVANADKEHLEDTSPEAVHGGVGFGMMGIIPPSLREQVRQFDNSQQVMVTAAAVTSSLSSVGIVGGAASSIIASTLPSSSS